MDRFAQIDPRGRAPGPGGLGLDVAADPERVGASIATGIGGLRSFQDCYDVLRERGPDRVNPFAIPCIIPNMGAGWVSIELGHEGPADERVHRLRRLEHGDRRRARRDPAWAAPT